MRKKKKNMHSFQFLQFFRKTRLNFYIGAIEPFFGGSPRRIYRGADKIVSVSNCKNWFCSLLKCVSIIFILNIYVSDSTLSEDFRSAVSK